MVRKARSEMIAETRAKLLAAARHAFGTVGYAAASMDDFTAAAGLTRGALYHHFGDKKRLLEAVIIEIDSEMEVKLRAIRNRASDPWQGFVDESVAYVEMALEPEIQRIMLRDGPAVLGDPSGWPTEEACVGALRESIERFVADGILAPLDTEATARLLNGMMLSAALWIARSPDPEETTLRAVGSLKMLLASLRRGAAPHSSTMAESIRP